MISNVQKKHKLIKKNGIEYYTIDGMDKIHAEMLRLLKLVDKIAIENNISYWIAGGSMIGVARHRGFIPWDDDLDIELLKVDYIRLIKCLTEYCKNNDDVFLFYPAPQEYNCCNFFASTNCFLRAQGSPSVYPVKVDIRPYNCIKDTEENIIDNNKIKDIANRFVFGKSHGFVSDEEFSKIDSKTFFKYYNEEYGLYDAKKEDAILVPPYYEYSINFEFNYNHLFPLVKSKFEDMLTNIPKEYDYILGRIYGDYMKLPQIKHRVPTSCEFISKKMPFRLYLWYFRHNNYSRLRNLLYRFIFLAYLHGVSNIIKYKYFEKKVQIDSNYEEAEW